MHLLLFPVNNFFQSFFRKGAFGASLGAAVPQRVFELCPFTPILSNTFLDFFGLFSSSSFNILIILYVFYDFFFKLSLCLQRRNLSSDPDPCSIIVYINTPPPRAPILFLHKNSSGPFACRPWNQAGLHVPGASLSFSEKTSTYRYKRILHRKREQLPPLPFPSSSTQEKILCLRIPSQYSGADNVPCFTVLPTAKARAMKSPVA